MPNVNNLYHAFKIAVHAHLVHTAQLHDGLEVKRLFPPSIPLNVI